MRCIVRVAAGRAPPMRGQKLLFLTSKSLCWSFEFFSDSWYLKASFRSPCEILACGLKTSISKKARLNFEPNKSFAFTFSRASSSVVVELLTKLSLCND